MSAVPAAHILRLAVVVALAAAALVAIGPGRAAAVAPPCQRTYTNDTDYPIPDGVDSGVTSPIDVEEDGLVVTDVDVSVNIDHTFVGDLELYLESATDANTEPVANRLMMQDGRHGDDIQGVVLDDEASTPVSWASAPFTGRFKPNQALSAHDGSSGGQYELWVADMYVGVTGTLKDWSLTLTYESCDFDGDGVEDPRDACLGRAGSTASGCPLTTRALSATYRSGRFRGALSSPVVGCKAAKPVTIWKVRSGADRKVGTATTASDGRFKLARAKKRGRYYAAAPRVAVAGVAECPAVLSKTFRIR